LRAGDLYISHLVWGGGGNLTPAAMMRFLELPRNEYRPIL